jgi:hypothetical protein
MAHQIQPLVQLPEAQKAWQTDVLVARLSCMQDGLKWSLQLVARDRCHCTIYAERFVITCHEDAATSSCVERT